MSLKSFSRLVERRLPGFWVGTFFDVGANVGQSVLDALSFFPEASYHCFEPGKETFEELQSRLQDHMNVTLNNCALSAATGDGLFHSRGTRTDNRLVSEPSQFTHSVRLVKGDDYVRERCIQSIDFLKIDTEGHDLDVIVGFSEAVRSGMVKFVQVEVAMNNFNRVHVPFSQAQALLGAFNLHPFHMINLAYETGAIRCLRRADVIFAHASVFN